MSEQSTWPDAYTTVETDELSQLRASLERWFQLPYSAPPHQWVEAERKVKEASKSLWPDIQMEDPPPTKTGEQQS